MSRTLVIQPEVADADRILAATALTTSAQTITAALAQPDVYRVLSITGNAAGITGNVVITGTDWDGDDITDTIALSGASTVNGVKPFRSVSSLTLPIRNAPGDTVSVGVAALFGFPVDVAAVALVERAAATATAWTSEAVGTVNTTYGTLACTVTAGDRLRFTYTEAGTGHAPTRLFTVAEARAFDKGQLADAALHTSAAIAAEEESLRREFREICGVAFVPAHTSETHWGQGDNCLILDWPVIGEIIAITETDSAGAETVMSAADVALITWEADSPIIRRLSGTFSGDLRYTVEYTNGLTQLDEDIRRAALMVAVRRLVTTDLPWEATGGTFEGFNWTATVDPSRSRWYGNDRVDGILARYRERYYLPGIA